MQVNLAIDQGNSAAKVAIFCDKTLVEVNRYSELTTDLIEQIASRHNVRGVIYSSVRTGDEAVKAATMRMAPTAITLDYRTPMPITIGYQTPQTLGHDRIAAAVGALEDAQGNDTLVIDAGTALTLDTVTADGIFQGGNISPGLRMRLQALHSYTSKLPQVEPNGERPLIGNDTSTAIRSGVEIGIACEIDGYIGRLAQLLQRQPRVVITGGDCHTIASLMNTTAEVDEHLVMKGLNRILLYNETP